MLKKMFSEVRWRSYNIYELELVDTMLTRQPWPLALLLLTLRTSESSEVLNSDVSHSFTDLPNQGLSTPPQHFTTKLLTYRHDPLKNVSTYTERERKRGTRILAECVGMTLCLAAEKKTYVFISANDAVQHNLSFTSSIYEFLAASWWPNFIVNKLGGHIKKMKGT